MFWFGISLFFFPTFGPLNASVYSCAGAGVHGGVAPPSVRRRGEWTAGGRHMLSQLGLAASYSDTLTLIHAAGEVLRLAR